MVHSNILGGGPQNNDMNPDERAAAHKQLGNKIRTVGGGVSGGKQRRRKTVVGSGPRGSENNVLEPFTNCYC